MTNNALKPCEYCAGDIDDRKLLIESDALEVYIDTAGRLTCEFPDGDFVDTAISNCPMCGRKLEEPPCNTKTP